MEISEYMMKSKSYFVAFDKFYVPALTKGTDNVTIVIIAILLF